MYFDDDFKLITDTAGAIVDALGILRDKYPETLAEIIQEREDADTGDILFQLICFGEVVYG